MKADLVLELKVTSGIAFDQAWSPSGDLLVVAGLDPGLCILDVRSGGPALNVPHGDLLSCVDWNSAGDRLVAGSSAGEILVIEAAEGTVVAGVQGHTDEVRSVAFSPDGRLVASGANDGTARVWQTADLRPVAAIAVSSSLVRSVAWSPDGGSIATGGEDAVLRVWDARTGELRGGLGDHRGFITAVAFSPDGRLLASASHDSTVRVWDLSARAYAAVLDDFDRWWVEGMCFSPDGQFLAAIDQTGHIRGWHLGIRKLVLELSSNGFNKSVSWSPDGRRLASGGALLEQAWTLSESGPEERRTPAAADPRTAMAADSPGDGRHPDPAAGDGARAQQLAREYGQACAAVMGAAQAALNVANEAFEAWKMAQQRPQHEISIQTFANHARHKEAEFAPLFRGLQAAVVSARAAGAKLSGHFSESGQAEMCLALALDEELYRDVGAAIQFLRADAPADARAFHDFIPQINQAIQAAPAFGEPGFPGNIYSDPRAAG
jgi:dipeptidyl aminopeptidase/acylaminoacyl peptidase